MGLQPLQDMSGKVDHLYADDTQIYCFRPPSASQDL